MKPRMCSVWAWKYIYIYIYISISFNHKCCIEGGLINFNYKRNLAFRIILAFFPSLVANVLRHNHLVEPGVEGRKVTSHSVIDTKGQRKINCTPNLFCLLVVFNKLKIVQKPIIKLLYIECLTWMTKGKTNFHYFSFNWIFCV
jgi:hypothetical protein